MSSFNQIYSEQINKICIVFNKSSSGSGLLFWYDTRLYLLTVKHLLNNIINPIMYSIVSINIWNKNKYKYEQVTQVLGFICIGYDTTSDIAVCSYNSTLNINNNNEFLSTDKLYNKNFIEAFEYADIIDSRELSVGDKICIIGQSMFDNNTMSSGIIKDNAYNGFPGNSEMVESILCDVASYNRASGSPIINLNNKICGIVVGGFDKYFDHLTIGVSSKILRIVIPKLIKKYVDFDSKNSVSDISRNLLSLGYLKCYLGIDYSHVNYNYYIINNELQNKLKNIGGILVYDFIVGLDTLKNFIIYNYEKITNSTIIIHNPFQYNVITIQLTTNTTINQIISTHKTPFRDLQIMNNFLGLNENSIINSGLYINVFNNLNINTKLWQTFHDKIHKSYPLIFTKIWFTRDYYINNINIGQWVDLNIGKFRGQVPLSDYIYECSRDIINDSTKNIPVYRFNSNNMANVVDKSNTKIENMVDMNGDTLTIGDIIFEFYYNISQSIDLSNNQGSWQGPVYQKIKPYIIYNNISKGQNNTNSYVLSIEQPDILNNLESTLQIDMFDGSTLIEKRSTNNFAKLVEQMILGSSSSTIRNLGSVITSDVTPSLADSIMDSFLDLYNSKSETAQQRMINSLPNETIFNTIIDDIWGLNSSNEYVKNLISGKWLDFILNNITYREGLP